MSAEISGKHLHFIGIGGSSMSGLARFMLQKGCAVSGSDRDASHKTEALEKLGVKIYIGHTRRKRPRRGSGGLFGRHSGEQSRARRGEEAGHPAG